MTEQQDAATVGKSGLHGLFMRKHLDVNLAVELGKLVVKQFGDMPRNFGLQLARTAADMGHGCSQAINIIFDGPPGPEAGRFIEVETDDGKSVNAGEWIERDDGTWALRIRCLPDA